MWLYEAKRSGLKFIGVSFCENGDVRNENVPWIAVDVQIRLDLVLVDALFVGRSHGSLYRSCSGPTHNNETRRDETRHHLSHNPTSVNP